METKLQLPVDSITDFCVRYRIQRLAVFGSILSSDFNADSDIDVLVEFESGYAPGFLGFTEMQNQLTDLLGRPVDLNTPSSLSRYFRQNVLDNAQVIYQEVN